MMTSFSFQGELTL